MGYENSLMTELMVPRDPEVASRMLGFYEAINWAVRNSTKDQFFTYVSPPTSSDVDPAVAYWQTENKEKIAHFGVNEGYDPTIFARGLRLAERQELVEVCLVVPGDDDVHNIFDIGGRILERHTHIPPRDHAGKQEFRFADPFNYSLRVTADPGWEIVPPEPDLAVQAAVLPGGVTVLTGQLFKQIYGSRGGRHSWDAMLRAIGRHPDCPLRIIDQDGEVAVEGDIAVGIEWFNNRGVLTEPVFVRVLKKAIGTYEP